MPYLTWENKYEAIKKAKNTPYRLLREVAEFSQDQIRSDQIRSDQIRSAKILMI